jgi:YVTN family beta-propeller protein
VASQGSGTIAVINTATQAIVSTISVAGAPRSIGVSADGTTLYVTNLSSNSLIVINAATGAIMASVPVGSSPIVMGTFVDAPAASVGGGSGGSTGGGTGGGTVTNNEEAERDQVGEHDEGKHHAYGEQEKDADESGDQQQGNGGQHTQDQASKGIE